jgi:spore coat protein U-like protein
MNRDEPDMGLHMIRRLLLWPMLFLGSLFCAQAAQALCVLGCSCNVTVTSVVFAPFNPLTTGNNDSAGNVRVVCGGGAGLLIGYTVALSAGGSNSIAARTMSSGAAKLAYNLFTSNSYTTVWGDGTGTSGLPSGGVLLDVIGNAPPQDFPVYARMPGPQTSVAPGSYSDSVVVTLTYF